MNLLVSSPTSALALRASTLPPVSQQACEYVELASSRNRHQPHNVNAATVKTATIPKMTPFVFSPPPPPPAPFGGNSTPIFRLQCVTRPERGVRHPSSKLFVFGTPLAPPNAMPAAPQPISAPPLPPATVTDHVPP